MEKWKNILTSEADCGNMYFVVQEAVRHGC